MQQPTSFTSKNTYKYKSSISIKHLVICDFIVFQLSTTVHKVRVSKQTLDYIQLRHYPNAIM